MKKISKFSALTKYLRVVNYISAAQLYLQDNFFLEKELQSSDIKSRLLGHWGGVPGVNFIYANLNFYLKSQQDNLKNKKSPSQNNSLLRADENQKIPNLLFILGPGHTYPALAANLFLEKTLTNFFGDNKYSNKKVAKNIYDFQISYDRKGLGNLIKYFGTRQGFPTHASPVTPGAILEGGELGYSMANAAGSVLDNSDLITVCVIGDGEFETGTLATSMHVQKFINSKSNGVILPIINLNGYKISGPTILGRMTDKDLISLFTGYGYEPQIIDATSETKILKNKNNYDLQKDAVYILMQKVLAKSFLKISELKKIGAVRGLPLIILKSDKGWTGPKYMPKDGKNIKVEGNCESHQVPFSQAKENPGERKELEKWLRSYKIEELLIPNSFQDFSDFSKIKQEERKLEKNISDNSLVNLFSQRFQEAGVLVLKEIEDILPAKLFRMGENLYVLQNGKGKLKELILPKLENILNSVRDKNNFSPMRITGQYLREVFKLNDRNKNFRFFSPDETYSNNLDIIFQEEARAWTGDSRPWDKNVSPNGRVIEMLSENTLIGCMMGYILTGRHAWFASYEAFVQVASSMVDQYIKFLSVAININWRGDVSGFNIILTASSWAQEHNGFSHQNPGFIDDMLLRNANFVNLYFPLDAMATVYAVNAMAKSKNKVNILIAGKDDDRPIFLNPVEAEKSIAENMILLEKFSDQLSQNQNYDTLICGIGDYVSAEAIYGIELINKLFQNNQPNNQNKNQLDKLYNLATIRRQIKIGFLNIAKITTDIQDGLEERTFEKKLAKIIGLPINDNNKINNEIHNGSEKKKQTKVFVNFHGHPQSMESYFYKAGVARENLTVRGYVERGGIATLLEMHLINRTSRYHVAEFILESLLFQKKIGQDLFEKLNSAINSERDLQEK